MTTSPMTARANPLTNVSPDAIAMADADRALVGWVCKQYQKMKNARQPYERQWRLNYAMYKGRQNLTYSGMTNLSIAQGGGRLVEPKAPPWRVRAIRNRIKPIIRTELARFTSNKPNASVVPASFDDEDLFAAQAGERVWEYFYNTKQLHKEFSRCAFWMCITGVGFMKTWWDPTEKDANQAEHIMGDVCTSPVTPFHLFVPDLMEVDIQKQPYVINAYTKPVEWIKQNYPELSDIQPTIVAANEIMGDSMFKAGTMSDAPFDSCLVLEMWIKPGGHPRFPDGGMVTLVDKQIVDGPIMGLPYKHGMFPFVKFDHIPTGEFYSDSVINDLISPQREYNRTTSQIIEAKNRMAKPQLTAAQGSVDPAKITSEPGQVILYKPGFQPPQPLPLQGLPSYVIEELSHALQDMEDISSQHAVSRGETPSGVTAATAISYLQERDDSPNTSAYQSIEFGWESLAKMILSLAVQYWDIPRMISITGIEGTFDAITLKGSQIENGTDVRIEAGSALPVSKAARQAFLMDLMKGGFIPPEKALALMDMGGIQKLYDELRIDEAAAQRENLRMRRLDIEEILQHQKMVEQSQYLAEVAQQQQQMQGPDPAAVQQQMPGLPQDVTNPNDALAAVQGLEQMQPSQPQVPKINAGFGQDQQTQAPLTVPPNIVPVNTWDNHQTHIDVHNRFRKSQAFDMLPDEIKQQFEAHVATHAMALAGAAQNASMMPPPPDSAGPNNGSGTPIGGPPAPSGGGGNQFPPSSPGGPPNG